MHAVNPEGWPRPRGYANAVIAEGRTIFLAGMVGWNEAEEFETDELAGQFRQALTNIVTVLRAADSGPEHLVRLTWFITDKEEYLRSLKEIGAAYRDIIGRHFPAMSVIEVKGFIEPRAVLEIEATAVIPR